MSRAPLLTWTRRSSTPLAPFLAEVEHRHDVRDQRRDEREGKRHVRVKPDVHERAIAQVATYAVGEHAFARHGAHELPMQRGLLALVAAAERDELGRGRARRAGHGVARELAA